MSTSNQQLKALETAIQSAHQKFKEGDTDSALQHVQEGICIDENNSQLLEIAANIYLKLNDHQKTIQYAQRLKIHHPTNRFGYIRHAQGLLIGGHACEAHELL